MAKADESEGPTHLTQKEWEQRAKTLLRVELTREGVTYDELARRLQAIGVKETEISIRNKVSRGTFPATFLLQSMQVLGVALLPVKPQFTAEVQLSPELVAATQGLRWPKGAR